jgi:hypothetical protein
MREGLTVIIHLRIIHLRTIRRRLAAVAALTVTATALAAGVATPAQAVPNMTFHTSMSVTDSAAGKLQTARCPAGRRVLGGGGFIGGGGREVHIDHMRPVTTPAGDSFEVIASEVTHPGGIGYPGSWYLLAYAICGTAPAGLEYVSASSAPALAASHSVVVSCPAGKRVIGAAGQVEAAFGFIMLDEVTPLAGLTGVRVSAFQSETPSPIRWRVTATAVCANPIPGLTLVSALSPADSLDKFVDVTCPAGTRIHSTGWDLVGAVGQGMVVAIFPGQPLTTAHLRAREDLTGLATTWQARVFAICAN